MNALPAITPLSDDEFDRLIGEGDPRVRGRVELRKGALRRINAEFEPHVRMVGRLTIALHAAVQATGLPLETGPGGSVRFGGGFTPMPDVIVFAPSGRRGAVPGANVKLAVEVADSTRADDLGDKRREYAKAGLPEYWVADITRRVIHRFSAPQDGDYTRSTEFREGQEIASDTLPGVAVTVLFP